MRWGRATNHRAGKAEGGRSLDFWLFTEGNAMPLQYSVLELYLSLAQKETFTQNPF